MDRWAAACFDLRVIHGKLHFGKYGSAQVRQIHDRILERLKRRCILVHDYRRYGQAACEFGFGLAPAARMPPPLEEFPRQLEAHRHSGDA